MTPEIHNKVGKYAVMLGTDHTFTVTFPAEWGVMTGYHFTSKIKTKANHTFVVSWTTSFNSTTRVLTMTLTSGDMATITPDVYEYDIKMTNASNLVPKIPIRGDVEFRQNVT